MNVAGYRKAQGGEHGEPDGVRSPHHDLAVPSIGQRSDRKGEEQPGQSVDERQTGHDGRIP